MRPIDVTPVLIAHETERLLDSAASLTDDTVLSPSLCEGWTRGHVLTHVARNADGLARVCRAILSGTGETMYAADDVRDAEIAAGCRRSAVELATDVQASAEALAPLLALLGPQHTGRTAARTPGGVLVPAERVRYLRLRELVYHHADLRAGFTFADVAPQVLALFLDETIRSLTRQSLGRGLHLRTDEGDEHTIGDGATRVTGTRAAMLAWLGRGQTDHVRADGPLPSIPAGV